MATLTGGNHEVPSLYYSSASAAGYTVVAVPGADFAIASFLTVSEARAASLPEGYQTMLAGTLDYAGRDGNGAAGARFASSTIMGGGGATTIGAGSMVHTAAASDFFVSDGAFASLTDRVTHNSAGAGNFALVTGAGVATLTGGLTQGESFEIGALAAGSHAIAIANWAIGDKLTPRGLGAQLHADQISVAGGDATVTLGDGTLVTFTGITNAADIVLHGIGT